MNYFHKADHKLAKWIDDLAEGKIQKKASPINDVMIPYGLTERATQLKSSVMDDALNLFVEEKQDEELEKKIEEATTPEELEELEKQLETEEAKPEETPEAKPEETPEAKPEETEETTPEIKTEEKPEETPAGETAEQGIEELKKEIKQLKEEVDDLSGEEKIQHEVDLLKKRLDNIVVQDDSNLNDSIFQEGKSKVAHCKRCLRRIRTAKEKK